MEKEIQMNSKVPASLAKAVNDRRKDLKQNKKVTMERMCRAYLKATSREAAVKVSENMPVKGPVYA